VRGMTRAALAAAAGTTPWCITRIERHGHVPRADLRRRIAEALGVDESDVWPEMDNENRTTRTLE